MSSKSLMIAAGLGALLVVTQTAGAHPWPYHVAGGFAAGVAHPFSGLDHILAMIAVGICAAQMGGRAIWLLPTAFLSFMIVGGAAGVGHADVPAVEQIIAASVLVLGLIIAGGSRLPMLLTVCLVGLFAIFHGYAHGTELQSGLAPATYTTGFIAATAALHAIGLGLGFASRRIKSPILPRIVGGLIAIFGVVMVWM